MNSQDTRSKLIEYIMINTNEKFDLDLTAHEFNRIWESMDCFLDVVKESDYEKIKAIFDRRILRK